MGQSKMRRVGTGPRRKASRGMWWNIALKGAWDTMEGKGTDLPSPCRTVTRHGNSIKYQEPTSNEPPSTTTKGKRDLPNATHKMGQNKKRELAWDPAGRRHVECGEYCAQGCLGDNVGKGNGFDCGTFSFSDDVAMSTMARRRRNEAR